MTKIIHVDDDSRKPSLRNLVVCVANDKTHPKLQTIRVDQDVHKALKIGAAKEGEKNINDYIRHLMFGFTEEKTTIKPIRTRHGGVPL